MFEAYKEMQQQFPEDFEHNLFPDENGLLPWGYTDNGDELYWKTNKDCNNWEIVIYESRLSDQHSYEMCLTEFLYKYLSGKIKCKAFPSL